MKETRRWIGWVALATVGLLVLSVSAVWALGDAQGGMPGSGMGGSGMMGGGMMWGALPGRGDAPDAWNAPYGPGMMRGYGIQGDRPYTNTLPYGPGMMGRGMMGGYGMMGGMMGGGMMGGSGMMWSGSPRLWGIEPLSVETAQSALEDYLAGLGDEDLAIGEIMIFENHAYAEIVERSTGIGAMEVLVDPVTLAVVPEPGPNMMWNLKYGHMAGFNMMGWGYGPWGSGRQADVTAEMPVDAEEAVQIAQRYLDRYLPGAQAEDEADPFYGYYTIHILRDGEPVGMLSVNGFTRQVFLHTWHGDLVTMVEEE